MAFSFTQADKKKSADRSGPNIKMYDFLRANPVGVLATVDPQGDPYAAVIYYSVNKDFDVTFTTKRNTKKNDDIQHNDHVQLTVYEAASQTMAQLTGIAKEITDALEAQEAFRATVQASLRTSLAGLPPVSKLQAGYYIAYKIHPKQLRMAVFSRPTSELDEIFQTVNL
jgi:general stress protein 26